MVGMSFFCMSVSVNGTTIVTTAEHPFWVSGEGWVEARDLKKGDMLVDLDENEVPIEEIKIKKERTTVYNFRVQSVHNYFVTDLKIWTHNCGGSYGGMSGARLSSSSSGARVGGVGGGYSRPANVIRGTTGIRIEVSKKSADQFYKSVMDKAMKPKVTGNGSKVTPITLSDSKMYQLGDHFNKHGRGMGYESKKAYDLAAKEFASINQNNPKARIVEGTWNGSGSLNGTNQRAITYDGRTVVIDTKSGQVIDFFVGTEYKGINVIMLQ